MATVCDLGATQPPCPTCGAAYGHTPLCGALKAAEDAACFGFGAFFGGSDGITRHLTPSKLPKNSQLYDTTDWWRAMSLEDQAAWRRLLDGEDLL